MSPQRLYGDFIVAMDRELTGVKHDRLESRLWALSVSCLRHDIRSICFKMDWPAYQRKSHNFKSVGATNHLGLDCICGGNDFNLS